MRVESKADMGMRWLAVMLLLLAGVVTTPAQSQAAPLAESNAAAECSEGVRLFLDGRSTEALPLLEAGFGGRVGADFASEDDLGQCALVLGLLRHQTGHADAVEALAVALDSFRRSGSLQLEGITLSSIGRVYYDQGRYEQARTQYEQALQIARVVGDRAGEAENLHNIGKTYESQGQYEHARAKYEQALTLAREVGDRPGEGIILNSIGRVQEARGRNELALQAYQQALAIQRKIDHRTGEATTLANIGEIYLKLGRYPAALGHYKQALMIHHEVGDHASEGITLHNIGMVYESQGRYTEAFEYYQQSLAISREVGNRAGEAGTLNNVGSAYHKQGRFAEALAQFEHALAIMREVGDQAGEGATLNNIGQVHAAQGQYAEALKHYEQALAIRREVGDQAGEGATLNNIGAVYQKQGRYAKALEHYEQALVIMREVGDQASEGAALNNISLVYSEQGQYAEALEAFKQALVISRQVGDRVREGTIITNMGAIYRTQGRYREALEAYEQALTISHEVGDGVGEGIILNNIGFVYESEKRLPEAVDAYEQAMEVFDSVRAVAGNEAGRAAFIAQYADLYARAIKLYHEQGQDEVAFFTSERGRARAFLDSLATGQVQLQDNDAADLLAREQEAYAARQVAQEALARARILEPDDEELIEELEEQLANAEKAYAAALDAVEARGDQLVALVPGRNTVLDLHDVQALLDEQTTLVSYQVLGESGTLAFVVTHDSFTAVELPEATHDNLQTTVSDLHQWLNRENPHPLPLQRLHDWLVAPLSDQIHTPQVSIIPHQMLHYVPFAALTDGENYFGERHTLSVLPSASALPFIQAIAARAQEARTRSALVFGDPATSDPSLSRLEFAADEARQVADLLGTDVYSDTEATEDRLWTKVPGTNILHLAAHGAFNQANPLYSAIALAPGSEHDGRLEAHEIYGLPLTGSDLVVLSACETNVGALSRGDELVGLTRAFFFAGSPTVVSSLWSVDDAATSELMVGFYRHWQTGLSKAQALQAAQDEVRAEYPSPFYWAAFVLSGDPGAWLEPAPAEEESASEATAVPPSAHQPQRTQGYNRPRLVLLLGAGAAGLAALLLVLLGTWVITRRSRHA